MGLTSQGRGVGSAIAVCSLCSWFSLPALHSARAARRPCFSKITLESLAEVGGCFLGVPDCVLILPMHDFPEPAPRSWGLVITCLVEVVEMLTSCSSTDCLQGCRANGFSPVPTKSFVCSVFIHSLIQAFNKHLVVSGTCRAHLWAVSLAFPFVSESSLCFSLNFCILLSRRGS